MPKKHLVKPKVLRKRKPKAVRIKQKLKAVRIKRKAKLKVRHTVLAKLKAVRIKRKAMLKVRHTVLAKLKLRHTAQVRQKLRRSCPRIVLQAQRPKMMGRVC